AFAAALGAFLCASGVQAAVQITIDKSTQHMVVEKDGRPLYQFAVSTGRPGFDTPNGKFQAFRMERDHFSKEWDDAPMPYSIFFTKVGHAIHGTYSKNIGMPVSHGCVRLSVGHAEKLWNLVEREGVLKTKVVLSGSEQIALKRGRTKLADREEDLQPQQPQYGQGYQQQPGQSDYYGRPQYRDPRYNDPRYADRDRDPRYGYPNYDYGYPRPPRYVQPQYP